MFIESIKSAFEPNICLTLFNFNIFQPTNHHRSRLWFITSASQPAQWNAWTQPDSPRAPWGMRSFRLGRPGHEMASEGSLGAKKRRGRLGAPGVLFRIPVSFWWHLYETFCVHQLARIRKKLQHQFICEKMKNVKQKSNQKKMQIKCKKKQKHVKKINRKRKQQTMNCIFFTHVFRIFSVLFCIFIFLICCFSAFVLFLFLRGFVFFSRFFLHFFWFVLFAFFCFLFFRIVFFICVSRCFFRICSHFFAWFAFFLVGFLFYIFYFFWRK